MALPEVTNAYEVAITGVYTSQLVVNRFHFLASAGTAPNYPNLVSDIETTLRDPLLGIQHAIYSTSTIKITPLFGSFLGYEANSVEVGDIATGTGNPPFFAAQFRLLHGDRRVRPGQKRIGGIGEDLVAGLGYNGVYTTAMNAALAALYDTLTDGTLTFTPVIIHYPTVKYPDIITATITSSLFVGWTTQNSRKTGRGA